MSELQKYIDSQIAEISPLKKISLDIATRANAIEVTDKNTLKEALVIRKEITSHATAVKKERLNITRQFDDVKSQFIEAERDILEPTEAAKKYIGQQIMTYEEEQERLRQEEEARVVAITAQFVTNVKQLRSMKAVDARGAELKSFFSSLPEADQNNGIVKLALTQAINLLLERKDEIRTAEVDASTKAREEIDRKADLALAQLQAAETEHETAAEQKSAPKTGIKTVTRFTVVSPELVPRAFCQPSDQLIREAIRKGVTAIPGVEITEEKSF